MFGGSGAVVGVGREGHAGGNAIIAGIDAVSDGSSLRGSGVFFWQSKMHTSLQSKTQASLAPRLHKNGITMP